MIIKLTEDIKLNVNDKNIKSWSLEEFGRYLHFVMKEEKACVSYVIDLNLKKIHREWYSDDYVGGYYDEDGNLVVCEEYGTDADFDTHSVDVQNGYGYYDENGYYCSYHKFDNDYCHT